MRIVPFHQRFTAPRPPPPTNGIRLMNRQCARRRGFRSRGTALGSNPEIVQPVLARGTCVHIVGVFQSAIPAEPNNLGE
ncbi:hypothetical protein NECAME_16659 [Necator americanus]|uniref:Uncharacterized protein n=1 Tax=Necator americanus TaxID=51031 RepID=W2TXK8_NECAM|nr:hypothetical protein NECAME_16659 [Necator americanus]ETN85771.1 hypothetical protein NECAME_16659 [Necator americanus]